MPDVIEKRTDGGLKPDAMKAGIRPWSNAEAERQETRDVLPSGQISAHA
jgi:hypothetical protein